MKQFFRGVPLLKCAIWGVGYRISMNFMDFIGDLGTSGWVGWLVGWLVAWLVGWLVVL